MKPRKLGRIVLREEFFCITQCMEEAMILNQMCYWSERIEDIDKFLEEEYTMLVDHVPVLSHGWIYKSASQLVEEMFGAISEKTMNRVLDRLVKKNFLHRRVNPNPRYRFDKTYHYRVNFVEIISQLNAKNMPLSGYAIIEECAERINKGVAPIRQNDASIDHSDGAIPETITKITYKEENPIIPLDKKTDLFQTEKIAKGKNGPPRCEATPENNFPAELDSPDFLEVWEEYLEFRKQNKWKTVEIWRAKLLKKLVSWGKEDAIASLNASMESGYQGVFQPKEKQTQSYNPYKQSF